MICVIATIGLTEGSREEFLTVFRALVPQVLAEEGCVEYCPMIDIPTGIGAQPAVEANVVTVVEKWETLDALEAHLMAPHMLEFRASVKSLVVETDLKILEPA